MLQVVVLIQNKRFLILHISFISRIWSPLKPVSVVLFVMFLLGPFLFVFDVHQPWMLKFARPHLSCPLKLLVDHVRVKMHQVQRNFTILKHDEIKEPVLEVLQRQADSKQLLHDLDVCLAPVEELLRLLVIVRDAVEVLQEQLEALNLELDLVFDWLVVVQDPQLFLELFKGLGPG